MRAKIIAISKKDAYYDDRAEYIGKIATFKKSDIGLSSEKRWWKCLTCFIGKEEHYFYAVKIKILK